MLATSSLAADSVSSRLLPWSDAYLIEEVITPESDPSVTMGCSGCSACSKEDTVSDLESQHLEAGSAVDLFEIEEVALLDSPEAGGSCGGCKGCTGCKN